MNEDGQSIYTASIFTFVFFVKFYALNVVISLSDWTPYGEFFNVHKSPVNLKEKMLTNLYKPRAYI